MMLFAALVALAALPAVALDEPSPYRLKFTEYVEQTTNLSSYIDTEYVPNANTEIEMEFAFTTNLEAKTYVFGEYGNAGRLQFSYGPTNCSIGFGANANWDNAVTGVTYNTEKHVVKYVRNDGFYFDGTKVVPKAGVNMTTWDGTAKKLYLGACNSNGSVNNAYISPIRIYSCKIWDNGVLVRNFMPAKTERDMGVLYDTVNRKIHYAYGNSWRFVAGGEEVLVNDYREADYIEANQTAYICTGYTPNANTELEMDFAFTSILTNKTYVFGSYGSNGRLQFSYGPADVGCFVGYGKHMDRAVMGLPYNTERHVVKYVKTPSKGFYFDDIFVNSNTGTNLTSWSGTGAKLFLGQVNPNDGKLNPTNLAPIRIYSCKIWETNTVMRNLVPKQRVLDGKNGLYDSVTGYFYAYYGDSADFTAELLPGLMLIIW